MKSCELDGNYWQNLKRLLILPFFEGGLYMSMSAARKAKNREVRHRGAFIRDVEREYHIIDKQLEEKKLLAEALLLGTNKYGNKYGNGRVTDKTPIGKW